MENRYSGGSRRKWGATSGLPEKGMNPEGAGYVVNNRRMSNGPVNGRYVGDDEDTTPHTYSSVNHLSARRGFRETSPQVKDPDRLSNLRSSRAGNSQWGEGPQRFQAFAGTPGEPQYRPPPFYGYGRSTGSQHDAYGPNSFENLEQDRAVLMWKLEQLNHQISISKATEQRLPSRRNMVANDHYNARFTHYDGPPSSSRPYNMEVPSIPVRPDNFRDPFGPQIVGGTGKYTRHPPNGPFLKEHMEYIDPEPFELYQRDPFPPHWPGSRKSQEDSFDPQLHDYVSPVRGGQVEPDPVVFGSQDQLHPHEWQSISSSSNNSHNLGKVRAEIGLASNKSRKHHAAIAGGAPFIICSNCFNLLRLPRRLRIREKNSGKAQCGSCSSVICLQLEEKRLIASIIEDSEEAVDNIVSSGVLDNGGNARSPSLSLSDYGGIKSNNDCKQNSSWTKSEEDAFPGEQEVDVGHNGKMAGFGYSLSSLEDDRDEAEEEENWSHKEATVKRDDHTSPALSGSPLERDSRDSASMAAYESRWENESSDNLKKEKAFIQKSGSPHDSFKDDPNITEVDVSASEYPITSYSQDSLDTSKEEEQPKNKKGGGRSFFKGLMNRSVREKSMPDPIIENETEVTVNGHPIPDHVVKQAEVLAGPILPGDYWYDYHSGFWGVMKHPCLGILPPFIEEFNYTLPTNCSGGDTGIFVNGRQLHQHDLKMLTSRGLPTTRNQFYVIDIFGKVIDEDTGEELCDLGKLAPTVVKAGRGFGMRVPKGMMM